MSRHDITIRRLAERDHNIVRRLGVDLDRGHFLALEQPQFLVDEFRTFLSEVSHWRAA